MLIFAFILALLATLFIPSLFPSLSLVFFAPFLILVYYRKSFISSLWMSLICGFLLDLVTSEQRLGLLAINYCLTTTVLYQQKQNFFEDSISTVPLMTLFFSLISALFQVILLYFFSKGISLSWEWVGTDLLIMPLLDGLYAFLFFTLPLVLFQGRRRGGDEYFQ